MPPDDLQTQPSGDAVKDRRPLTTRSKGWAKSAANVLISAGISPNAISVIGIFLAAAAAICLVGYDSWPAATDGGTYSGWRWSQSAMLLAAGFFIQMRLLCNMLDGMVAVEGGKQSPTGLLYNEVPDRFEDVMILAAAGYAISRTSGGIDADLPWWLAQATTLGWLCAVGAVLTAYVRVQGSYMGTIAMFHGPMAKPHRMFAMTLACIVAAIAAYWVKADVVLYVALWVILIGIAITIARRLMLISRELHSGV